MTLADVAEPRPSTLLPADPTQAQSDWWHEGFYIAEGLLPLDLLDRYAAEWIRQQGVWPRPEVAYLDCEPMRDVLLHPPLMALLAELVGEPVGLHLTLTGWTSTERTWHQDDLLNPEFIDGRYAAVWIPLGVRAVQPDAGPFQIVPGSHRWPVARRGKVLAAMGVDGTDPDWPRHAEDILTGAYAAEIERWDAEVYTFLGSPGDVLVWSGRAVHRGSKPTNPDASRPALIAHLSALDARTDMPNRAQHGDDSSSVYFVL